MHDFIVHVFGLNAVIYVHLSRLEYKFFFFFFRSLILNRKRRKFTIECRYHDVVVSARNRGCHVGGFPQTGFDFELLNH